MPKEKQKKTQFFSEKTGNFYQLLETKTIPVLRINGVPMQRFSHMDPLTDTESKVEALDPWGNVLEISTGLGYTAIEMAGRRSVKSITTIEKDPEVLNMARVNDASKDLFENPKIKILEGDASELVKNLPSGRFDCILTDPPTFTIAPELYTKDFYHELFRLLRKGGKIWHYSPNPGMKTGKRFADRILLNMKRTGFKRIVYDEYSSGFTAVK